MHDPVRHYVAANVPDGGAGLDVLEIGAYDVNGSIRETLPNARSWVGTDMRAGPGVDVVATMGELVGRTDLGPVDVVVCCEVFEHATDDECRAGCRFAAQVLRKGGRLVATMAGEGRGTHSYTGGAMLPDEFYRNVTKADLGSWLYAAGFASWTVDVDGADLRVTAWK